MSRQPFESKEDLPILKSLGLQAPGADFMTEGDVVLALAKIRNRIQAEPRNRWRPVFVWASGLSAAACAVLAVFLATRPASVAPANASARPDRPASSGLATPQAIVAPAPQSVPEAQLVENKDVTPVLTVTKEGVELSWDGAGTYRVARCTDPALKACLTEVTVHGNRYVDRNDDGAGLVFYRIEPVPGPEVRS